MSMEQFVRFKAEQTYKLGPVCHQHNDGSEFMAYVFFLRNKFRYCVGIVDCEMLSIYKDPIAFLESEIAEYAKEIYL